MADDRGNSFDIRRATDRILGERDERLRMAREMVRIGVPFLDAATGGVRKTDFLLIGAGSGAGKTELATNIAKVNAEMGKRVAYFALEAEAREIERRTLYKLIANGFFRDEKRPKVMISYAAWFRGELDEVLEPYETQAQRIFDERYRNLRTIYRTRDFFVEDFDRAMDELDGQVDLAIIDHLHYFDYDEETAENRALSKIMKKLRDGALIRQVPQVLVAHLKKKEKRFGAKKKDAIMPDLEDFMGSSNIYKIPTMALLVAGAPKEDEDDSPTKWPTFMRIAKNRVDGTLTRYIARCTYDSERNEYERSFQLGRWRDGLDEFRAIYDERQLPMWARAEK
jgi:replicative DNA helicase